MVFIKDFSVGKKAYKAIGEWEIEFDMFSLRQVKCKILRNLTILP